MKQICLNMNIQIFFACGFFTLRISNERNSSSGETICHVFYLSNFDFDDLQYEYFEVICFQNEYYLLLSTYNEHPWGGGGVNRFRSRIIFHTFKTELNVGYFQTLNFLFFFSTYLFELWCISPFDSAMCLRWPSSFQWTSRPFNYM